MHTSSSLPESVRRWWPDPDPVIDLTTPEARAEYAALLAAKEPEPPHHVVDFHGLPQEPPRFRPRRQYARGLVPVVRASDGRRFDPYE
ncbi:hypothetical protein ABZY81_18125 [Streptomyces sp. NPDC006514]|uniref:hypothetical protein n=1 Tax=Streptomyces sp. NPDC006514 TaxID=3154308 RepID=UPI0033B1984D